MPLILRLFPATCKLLVPKVPLKSVSINSSPTLGAAGNVTVNEPPLVSQKYPSAALAVKLELVGLHRW